METKLSKDAIKICKIIYKEYKENGKDNFDDSLANRNDIDVTTNIATVLEELEDNGLITTFSDMSFSLNSPFKVFMENRVKDNVKSTIDTVSKLIP